MTHLILIVASFLWILQISLSSEPRRNSRNRLDRLVVVGSGDLKFLAFGDSLTEGFSIFPLPFHPYTLQLQQLFSKDNISVTIRNEGITGERTSQMIHRLPELLNGQMYDYVSILAGTNDLANVSESSESIFLRLSKLYNRALQSVKVTLIVITIPATSFDRKESPYLQKKLEINRRIQHFYEHHKESNRVALVDLYQAIPYYDEKGEKSSLWGDHLHFSAKGYDAMGDLIYAAIGPTLPHSK